MDYKVGDVINVIVVGSQPYGLFVKTEYDDGVTGLIHISEISYGFVKDVNQFAKVNDVLVAKILNFDKEAKHLKLSIKACLEKNRYHRMASDQKLLKDHNRNLKDFTPLAIKLSEWIAKELEKEEVQND